MMALIEKVKGEVEHTGKLEKITAKKTAGPEVGQKVASAASMKTSMVVTGR